MYHLDQIPGFGQVLYYITFCIGLNCTHVPGVYKSSAATSSAHLQLYRSMEKHTLTLNSHAAFKCPLERIASLV